VIGRGAESAILHHVDLVTRGDPRHDDTRFVRLGRRGDRGVDGDHDLLEVGSRSETSVADGVIFLVFKEALPRRALAQTSWKERRAFQPSARETSALTRP
jgi:hypothetical protein